MLHCLSLCGREAELPLSSLSLSLSVSLSLLSLEFFPAVPSSVCSPSRFSVLFFVLLHHFIPLEWPRHAANLRAQSLCWSRPADGRRAVFNSPVCSSFSRGTNTWRGSLIGPSAADARRLKRARLMQRHKFRQSRVLPRFLNCFLLNFLCKTDQLSRQRETGSRCHVLVEMMLKSLPPSFESAAHSDLLTSTRDLCLSVGIISTIKLIGTKRELSLCNFL